MSKDTITAEQIGQFVNVGIRSIDSEPAVVHVVSPAGAVKSISIGSSISSPIVRLEVSGKDNAQRFVAAHITDWAKREGWMFLRGAYESEQDLDGYRVWLEWSAAARASNVGTEADYGQRGADNGKSYAFPESRLPRCVRERRTTEHRESKRYVLPERDAAPAKPEGRRA